MFFNWDKLFKEITLGNFIEKEVDFTDISYSATILTRSKKTAFIVSCHPHKEKENNLKADNQH